MNRPVLITGAGSGIGLATAVHLAKNGYNVYASVPDLNQRATVMDTAAEFDVQLQVLQLDVTDSTSIHSAVDTIIMQEGTIYAVVNSAGLGMRGFFEDLSEAEIRKVFDINVFGVMAVSRAVLPQMRSAGCGRIVIISSAGGRLATMTISAYAAGKFALEGFGESLATEVKPFGIHVSLIEPGLILTPHFTTSRGRAKGASQPSSPYYDWFIQHEAMVDKILSANRIKPVDVAQAVSQALTCKRPKLRYQVGLGVKIVFFFKRILPSELFRKLYASQIIRSVTKPQQPSSDLGNLSLPGANATDYLGLKTKEGPKNVGSGNL